MPRGKKKSHKGGHRHFTSEDALAVEAEKVRRQQEWRAKKGIESGDEEEGGDNDDDEDKTPASASKPGELQPGSENEEEDEEEDEEDKPKGVSHLIEIENPNRIKQKTKKVASLSVDSQGPSGAPTLTRREREELEKQQAKEQYQKMQVAGKTDEARADLARLALVRKQREEAARKREEEKKVAEEVKTAAEQRLLDKKEKAGVGDKK